MREIRPRKNVCGEHLRARRHLSLHSLAARAYHTGGEERRGVVLGPRHGVGDGGEVRDGNLARVLEAGRHADRVDTAHAYAAARADGQTGAQAWHDSMTPQQHKIRW